MYSRFSSHEKGKKLRYLQEIRAADKIFP